MIVTGILLPGEDECVLLYAGCKLQTEKKKIRDNCKHSETRANLSRYNEFIWNVLRMGVSKG